MHFHHLPPPLILSILILLLPSLSSSAETTLGLYIFSRHGDRTSKSTPPTLLTDLGYSQVFASGSYFRSTYIANGSVSQIHNIADSVVKQSQITASAPLDNVLFPSALGFLQGLYPPVGGGSGAGLGGQRLRNGSSVRVPLDGYQLIPVGTVTSGTGSENEAWLQGGSNCAKAVGSSNAYFASEEYKKLEEETRGFYAGLEPLLNSTFSAEELSFKNAYAIYDHLNVASIHNSTLPSLPPSTLQTLSSLASTHEFSLAYNASSPIRAITGATLAAQILQALNTTVTSTAHAPALTIQFGAYGGFQSFFGLAGLTEADGRFFGIPDYASTMAFELFTMAELEASSWPRVEDLQVRFLFANGSASGDNRPVAYPLFGGQQTALSWTDFADGMGKFAVGGQKAWCEACGNSTGVCAVSNGTEAGASASGFSADDDGSADGDGVSSAVAGVIGAMVTLAVVLGVQGAVMLVGGLRLVRKKRVSRGGVGEGNVVVKG